MVIQFAETADAKLSELSSSVSQMNMLADELHNLRNRTSSLKIECQEIKGKFDETSVKISESLSKLQLKVEEQVRDFKGTIFSGAHHSTIIFGKI